MTEPASSVLEHTQTTTDLRVDEGEHELLAHYVAKAQLEAAIFTGTPTLALCGKLWLPSKDPSRFPVCPTCKDVFDQMQPGDPDSPDYQD